MLLCWSQVAYAQLEPVFVTKWGTLGTGDGQFSFPQSVAADAAGNIYVADLGNLRIQKFDSNGTVLLMWGFGVQRRHPCLSNLYKWVPEWRPRQRGRPVYCETCPSFDVAA